MMMQESRTTAVERVAQLEYLVAQMRHDVCGALSPAMLMADLLLRQPDPKVRLAAERIVSAIDRTTLLVRASRELVPPRAMSPG
jgi:signal transduction histidine kinase